MHSDSIPLTDRWLNRFLLCVALLMVGAALYRLQMVVAWQLATPFDIIFESPNLATIQAIRGGANVYDSTFFNAHPFIFTLYTPLYHMICASLPDSATNPFFTGRLVALTFMSAAALGALWVSTLRNWTTILLWMAPFLLLHPVVSNLAFLKNDGTALFFSILAILAVSRTGRQEPIAERSRQSGRTWGVPLAAFFCVLAFASKQVYLSATAACFVYLFFNERRQAYRFVLYGLVFGGIGAAAAQLMWGNGFWWCVFRAPSLPPDATQFRSQWELMLWQPTFLLLLVCSLVSAGEYFWQHKIRQWVANPFLLYLLFAGSVLLLTVGKPGSSTNYFIEPSLAAVFWLISASPTSRLGNAGKLVTAGLCAVATVCEVSMAKPFEFTYADPAAIERRAALHHTLLKEAGSLVSKTELRVLNLASASVFFDWPGESAINDPYLYTLLWTKGALKPDSMIRELGGQSYDLVVLRSHTSVQSGDGQDPVSQIMKALCNSYSLAAKGDYLQYWTRIEQTEKR